MGKRVIVEPHHDQQPHHHQQHHQLANDNHTHVTPVTTGARKIRKRKCNATANTNGRHDKTHKTQRLSSSPGHNNSNDWHDNDDEDSSSNDGPPLGQLAAGRNVSSKQANNSSILLNNSLNNSLTNNEPNASLMESPKPVYTLRPSVVNGTVLHDLSEKPWRLGRPIGKGNFGEIFLASDNISIPVTNENAKFVVKIEPHSNGPLFVEIHCLMNTAKKGKYDENITATASTALPHGEPSGIPDYIASGSHYFGNARYRFLVLPRFDRDLHSLIKKCRVHQKSVLTLAIHIITVLEHLHDEGYCHNDVKAQNLMISKCKYLAKQSSVASAAAKEESLSYANNNGGGGKRQTIKAPSGKYDHYEEKQQTTDSGNSSEQEANDDDGDDDFVVKRRVYNEVVDDDYEDSEEEEDPDDVDAEEDDEDFDDGATTNSTNSNSMDNYRTPVNKKRLQSKSKSTRSVVPYSGSNPVRSCRKVNGEKSNSIYDEMVKSHYLRPTKRVSYLEFFNEDNSSAGGNSNNDMKKSNLHSNSSDDESEEFVPSSLQRSIKRGTLKNSCNATTLLESRRLTRRQEKLLGNDKKLDAEKRGKNEDTEDDKKMLLKTEASEQEEQWVEIEEERIFLIDFGLASKYIDNGVHRPFVMDQRRAHDGTLEYTSRDAHMGAHSRRSDMECLGYNLLFWSQGYLPWKEAATNQQQEKVHRAKEYLMTDVRELLRQIYGKQVPTYIGEYLHLVGQLAYHERPDYNRYRRMFEREYLQLGYSQNEMHLQMREIQRTCVRVKEEIENKNDFFDMTKSYGVLNAAYSIMQSTNSCGTPFHERTLTNRVSPKNLRSKSDKKASKKKKFSWTEILSQDPDQIARERAEKEFDREEELSEVQQLAVRRYQGNPTYAILEILERMGRKVEDYEKERDDEQKANCENKAKELKEEIDMELDECDGYEPIYVVDESEEAETDATETFEHRKPTTANSRKKLQKSRKIVTVKATKTTASRRLVLKTPNNITSVEKSGGTSTIGKRTRCQKVKNTPQQTPVSTTSAVKRKKSATKSVKRGSAISKGGRKASSSGDTESAAASAAGEVEQQQQQQPESTDHSKRERRTRRCLLKTEQLHTSAAEGLLEDDSNSNFSPEGFQWKGGNHHTENVYARNYRK